MFMFNWLFLIDSIIRILSSDRCASDFSITDLTICCNNSHVSNSRYACAITSLIQFLRTPGISVLESNLPVSQFQQWRPESPTINLQASSLPFSLSLSLRYSLSHTPRFVPCRQFDWRCIYGGDKDMVPGPERSCQRPGRNRECPQRHCGIYLSPPSRSSLAPSRLSLFLLCRQVDNGTRQRRSDIPDMR